MRPALVLLCIASFGGRLLAHDPITTKITWTLEISRIVQTRCLACHAHGSSVALSSYAEARPWAKAIRDQVLSRQMPPWGAVPGAGDFRDDPSLTNAELERIVQWVEGGAPEGDPIYLPVPHAPPTPPPVRFATVARVSALRPLTLARARTFAGIRPDSPLEAIATLPDGAVRHLIWLHDYHARDYQFRDALRLPKGTVIRVTHGSAAMLALPGR